MDACSLHLLILDRGTKMQSRPSARVCRRFDERGLKLATTVLILPGARAVKGERRGKKSTPVQTTKWSFSGWPAAYSIDPGSGSGGMRAAFAHWLFPVPPAH